MIRYGFERCDWNVLSGQALTPKDNRGASGSSCSRRFSDFLDGTGQTLLATDVKVYQTLRRCSAQLVNVQSPTIVPDPAAPLVVGPDYNGGISGATWRAVGTLSGPEIVSACDD